MNILARLRDALLYRLARLLYPYLARMNCAGFAGGSNS